MIGEFGTTVINGMFVMIVDEGTVIDDPKGVRPSITVTDQRSAAVGHKLYCTRATEEKLIKAIDLARSNRGRG